MVKKFIVWHHSATPDGKVLADFDAIKEEHLKRGYRNIGYHYVIELVEGKLMVKKGREEDEEAAACKGPRNSDGIHICCVGNFDVTVPSEELYQCLAGLCRDIMTRNPIEAMGGHRSWDATACPGKNFDVDYIKKLVKEGEVMPEGAITATISVNGKDFPAYILNGYTFFRQGVSVRDFMECVNRTLVWDSNNLTLNIK